MKYVVAVLAIALGVAGMVAGGIDDSPGLQLLGVLLIVGAVALGVRIARRSRWDQGFVALRISAGLVPFMLLISAVG